MGIAIPVENPVYELFQARVTEYVEMMMKEHMSRFVLHNRLHVVL